VYLSIDGLALDLIESDIVIVRGGMSRQIHAVCEGADGPGARVIINPPVTMRRQGKCSPGSNGASARAVASSCGRRAACSLMFQALRCDDCGLCYRRGAAGPLGRRSCWWYGRCLLE
jgi:hypothetical protein